MDLFDRKDEKIKIKNILSAEGEYNPFSIWIEGIEGSGKTQFLKYIISRTNLQVFKFSDSETVYKCEKIDIQNEFTYISNVVFKILKNYPHKFQAFLQDYFDDQNRITLLDAGCLILPQLKLFTPIKKLFETKYDIIVQSQANINGRLINMQLVDFFSDVIIYYLTEIETPDTTTIFCIDDMQWIDSLSLKTLNSTFNKAFNQDKSVPISIMLTIRNLDSLLPEEKSTYNSVYKLIESHFPKMHTIVMNNFDFEITRQLVISKKRYFLEQNIHKIFQITNGNPMELVQTLRFSDDEVKRILDNHSNNSNIHLERHHFSQEMILSLYKENKYYVFILNILAIMGCPLSKDIIIKIMNTIIKSLYCNVPIYTKATKAIDNLIAKEFLECTIDGFSIAHDSMKSLIVNYLQSTGEYNQYVDIISDVLLAEEKIRFSKLKSNVFFALYLLKTVNPQKGFRVFCDVIKRTNEPLSSEIYEVAAECFCSDISNINIEVVREIVITRILPILVSSSKLKIGKRVCEYIFDLRTKFEKPIYIDFMLNYIKILVDMGVLNTPSDDEATAVSLFEELYTNTIETVETKLQVLLLGMSVYEHLLNFEKIRTLFDEAEEIAQSDSEISSYTLSRYYRNKGLVFSHRDIISDYSKACEYSLLMPECVTRTIMYGTCLNNLGLGNFYKGNIDEALENFTNSLALLSTAGCDVSRINNNIAICYYLKGNIESAYECMAKSVSANIDGHFINSCIKTNYALILHTLGETNEAVNILDELIVEYNSNNKSCQDEVPYSAAMLNKAFIHIQKSENLEAIKLIKMSCNQVYRHENELQQEKRTNLINYCLSEEGLIPKTQVDIDFDNDTFDIYKKPYSLLPVAYYVI